MEEIKRRFSSKDIVLNDYDVQEIESVLIDKYHDRIYQVKGNSFKVDKQALENIEIGIRLAYNQIIKKAFGFYMDNTVDSISLFNNPFDEK